MLEQLVLAIDEISNTKLIMRYSRVQFDRYYSIYEVDIITNKYNLITEYNSLTLADKYNRNEELLDLIMLAKCVGSYYSEIDKISKAIYLESLFERKLVACNGEHTGDAEADKVLTILRIWIENHNKDNRIAIVDIKKKSYIAIISTDDFKDIISELGFKHNVAGVAKLLLEKNKLLSDNPINGVSRLGKNLSEKEFKRLGTNKRCRVVIPLFDEKFVNEFLIKYNKE